jgi:hypothetical protein
MNLTRSAQAARTAALAGYPRCSTGIESSDGEPGVKDTTLALLLGSAFWLMGLGAYATTVVLRGRPSAITALLYNAPVAFVFLVLAIHLAVQMLRMGIREFVGAQVWTLVVWAIGGVVLYLRLVAKSIEVSGHMAWLPLLTAQSVTSGFPMWFSIVAGTSTLAAFYMKVELFRGPSGVPGAVVGLALATALLVAGRRPHGSEGAVEQQDAADGAG